MKTSYARVTHRRNLLRSQRLTGFTRPPTRREVLHCREYMPPHALELIRRGPSVYDTAPRRVISRATLIRPQDISAIAYAISRRLKLRCDDADGRAAERGHSALSSRTAA
jgi:hypothetical protein